MQVSNTTKTPIGLRARGQREVICLPNAETSVPDEVLSALSECPVTSARFKSGDLALVNAPKGEGGAKSKKSPKGEGGAE